MDIFDETWSKEKYIRVLPIQKNDCISLMLVGIY